MKMACFLITIACAVARSGAAQPMGLAGGDAAVEESQAVIGMVERTWAGAPDMAVPPPVDHIYLPGPHHDATLQQTVAEVGMWAALMRRVLPPMAKGYKYVTNKVAAAAVNTLCYAGLMAARTLHGRQAQPTDFELMVAELEFVSWGFIIIGIILVSLGGGLLVWVSSGFGATLRYEQGSCSFSDNLEFTFHHKYLS